MQEITATQTMTIDAAGIAFHAQAMGEHPRTIFLHGLGGDGLHSWDGVWSALGNELPALRYDLRGFGQSIDSNHAPFRHTDDLLAIMDAIELAQCNVIGVSMGGSIALNFALDHPGRVRNLILISPGMMAWEWSDAWRALWQRIADKARSGDMDGARELWWQHPLFATTRASGAASLLHESIRQFSGAQWIQNYEKDALPDVERLHGLNVRTLLLTGQRDFEDFRLIADLIEAIAPNLTRIDWPDRGHLLNLESPSDCAREIISFLDTPTAK